MGLAGTTSAVKRLEHTLTFTSRNARSAIHDIEFDDIPLAQDNFGRAVTVALCFLKKVPHEPL